MRSTWILTLAVGALLPLARTQQTGKAPVFGDWPMYAGNLAGTKYSPLTQIDAMNVSRLAPAWSYRLAERGAFETTPIVVDGVMYLPAGNKVVALDPQTGNEIWTFQLPAEQPGTRGVSYWPGDGTSENPPRIFFTAGPAFGSGGGQPQLVAVNARTGKLDPGFGKEGVVDLTVGWSGVPAIYKNVVMLGATVGEVPLGPPGNTRAYDARTGAKLWEFHSVPQPGEPGHETWLDDGWKGRSGTNIWGWYITVDEEQGLVYMPFGGPAANYYGGDRPGANLFGNSIVAADALTGKLKWYFQVVHHDLWDSDLPPAPGLVDLNVDGQKIRALTAIGKTAWMFILDRVTGKPVFGVEERPVPKGDVPGEWYSPTQPFPLKPPALARVSFKPEDLVTAEDTTPEHAKACRELYEKNGGFYNAGPFTPWLLHEDGAPPRSTIQFPGGTGGVNWGGTATDPRTGFVYVQSHDGALTGWVEKRKEGLNYGRGTEGSNQPYDRASVDGPGPYHGFSATVKDANGKTIGTWPCQKPPWARLSAVNANTGEILWQTPLGLVEGLPEGKQNLGNAGSAGPIVTAGGIVFIGATNDARFRAFDAKTGRELWVAKLAKNANANPITYQGRNGKQYVAVVASDTLRVFALP
ncbi:MAG: PQQ-binding-like beta-propeller repeat protein [Acidobacteriia bacterium]|nr:PQQ-binding-like beta-propeller repeat protein [Terriglobia bacterium]MBV8903637.1 PQQ-binding-like beta-propeller repeat protein [Terriglobia bacterium]